LRHCSTRFLRERLQDVVDDTELECFKAVLRGRGREHEHRRRGFSSHRADQVQTRARVTRGGELDVDEDDVHGRARHRLAGFVEVGHRADHFSALRVLDQLDQVVPRRPLVLEHQRLEKIRLAHDASPSSSGKLDDRPRTARRRLEPHRSRVRVPQRQPAPHRHQAERSRPRCFVRDAGPVILDGADEPRTGQLGADDDLAAARAHQRSVLHRVLDQRLQEKPGQERARRAVADLPNGT